MFILFVFFFNDTATTEIYTLSLHDALPISIATPPTRCSACLRSTATRCASPTTARSEEHTSELQSHSDLVCRLLLEKKKKTEEHNKRNGQTEDYINNNNLNRCTADGNHTS